jgi:hypothetical protein
MGLFCLATAGERDVYWVPTELTNTIVWLDAADTATLWADTAGTVPASSAVARWDDKSGYDNHMLQTVSSAQPTTGSRSISNINVLAFDGGDYLQEATNAFGAVISNAFVFLVVRQDAADDAGHGFIELSRGTVDENEDWEFMTWGWDTPNAMFRMMTGGDNNGLGLRNFTNGLQSITRMYGLYDSQADNLQQFWIDAVKKDENIFNKTVAPSAGIKVGQIHETGNYNGLMAEVVIMNGGMTTDERQILEGYLAWKWDFTSQLPSDHPYKSAAPFYRPGTVISLK